MLHCLNLKPIVVLDSRLDQDASDETCPKQHLSMKYFVRINGQAIEANSPQVIAQIMTDKIAESGKVVNESGRYQIRRGARHTERVESLMKAMEKQFDYDEKQLFLCDVQAGDVDKTDLEEAGEVEQQCHEEEEFQEDAWGDVNDYRLNPKMVRTARPENDTSTENTQSSGARL